MMKKILPYILTLTILIILFAPSISVYAQNEKDLGTCKYENERGDSDLIRNTFEACNIIKNRMISWHKSTNEEFNAELNCKPPKTIQNGLCVGQGPDGFVGPKDPTYHFLAPLPEIGPTFDPTGEGGGALGTYLNLMIKLFIGICAVLAVVMIVMGGIEYMTSELISSKEEGRKRITNAVFGLILALGAFTLLYTINPDLLNVDLSSLKGVTVVVTLEDDSVPQTADADGKYPNSDYKKGDKWGDNIGLVQDIPGVTKGFPECSEVGQSSCLSTRNLNLTNINEVKNKCPNASLQINGGTEFWHHGGSSGKTTHSPGSPTIDLQSNSALNICLSGGQSSPQVNKMYGEKYYYEGGHWHIGLGK